MKRRIALITMPLMTLAAFTLSLAGCGGGSSSSSGTTPIQTAPSLNGNWEIQGVSQTTAGTTYLMGVSMSTSGTAVSGILHFLDYSCFIKNGNLLYETPVTGTVTSAGALSLTSSPVVGQTFSLAGTVTNGTLTDGTYSVSGGCGAGEHGTITGFAVPSFTGTYKGTFTSVSGVKIGATITMTQTSTPDSDGFFEINGTAAFSGSPCFTSGPIAGSASGDVFSFADGGFVQVQITTGNGLVVFQGVVTDLTGNTIDGNYSVTGGTGCAGDSGTGSATR